MESTKVPQLEAEYKRVKAALQLERQQEGFEGWKVRKSGMKLGLLNPSTFTMNIPLSERFSPHPCRG
jgi:hypothetical protein